MDSLTMASSAVPPHLTCASAANNQENVNDSDLAASVGPICESASLHTMDTGGPDEVIQAKPIKPFSPGIPRSSPSTMLNEISKQMGSVGIVNNGIPAFGASPITDETQDKGDPEPGIKPSPELSPQFDLSSSHGACPTAAQSYSSSTVGSALSLSSVNTSSIMSPAPGNASAMAFTLPPSQSNKTQQQGLRPDLPQPPKKPLSPYMRFSKEIWQKVKADNPGMSVCEVGATIGRIWRELDEARKQLFILEFNNDKARYDTELQGYLRTNGLQASDIIKPRAKKSPKDPTSAKRSKGQNQKNHDAQHDLGTGTNYHRPTATSQCPASDVQQMNYGGGQEQRSQEMSVALPSFSQVWSNPDATTQRDLLAQVVYDSQLHDERDVSEIEGANQGISIFTNQAQLATNSISSAVCKNEQKIQLLKVPTVSQVKTEAGNWWWSVENDRNLGRNAFQQQTGSGAVQQQPSAGGSSFSEVAVKAEECLPNKTSEAASKPNCGWSEGNSKSTVVGNSSWLGQQQQQQPVATQRVQSASGEEKGGTAIDAEKLFLRGALVEKTQEVVQLMRELDQAYGLIHQLKTQNDFFHRWYQEQRNNASQQE